MPAYEVTLIYPDRSYDEHRRFLGSVAGSPPSGLDGFRRFGSGVALTFVMNTDLGEEHAARVALQHAVGMWPNFLPVTTTVQVVSDGVVTPRTPLTPRASIARTEHRRR